MTDELTRRLHRSPTAHELATELHVPVTDFARTLVAVNAFQTRSLDTPARETDGDPSMTIAVTFGDEDPRFQLAEDTITVAPLLAQLSADDQQLLIWRFYATLQQASPILGSEYHHLRGPVLLRVTGAIKPSANAADSTAFNETGA